MKHDQIITAPNKVHLSSGAIEPLTKINSKQQVVATNIATNIDQL